MAKYRKKPVVIDAVQYTGSNFNDIIAFSDSASVVGTELWIATLEGTLIASPGDWIVKGIKGEFYPVKPDIFEATYDAAD